MRRLFNALAVFIFVASLSVPVYATPRRDDGGDIDFRSPLKKIVQLVKKVVKRLDGGDMSIPRP